VPVHYFNVYYTEYTLDENGNPYPLYEYNIQNNKTTKLFNDGDFGEPYQNKLLLDLDGNEGGIFNMDTGKLEARFPLPSYGDEIPFLTLCKDKIIYHKEPTAALMEYDYKSNRQESP
jgi:hypothetical protein